MRKLNLGCGLRPKPQSSGWINIDFDPTCMPDIVRDIKNGLPFDDNSVDEIYISHVLEHLYWEDFYFVMREIWRVCKPDAKVEIRLPKSGHFVQDSLDHKIFLNHIAFDHYKKGYSGVSNTTLRVTQKYAYFKKESWNETDNNGPSAQLIVILRADKSLSENLNPKLNQDLK